MITEQQLASWTGPSSATEQEKQERTERMVRKAIETHPPFERMQYVIYAKGSYANNTNVRTDSDVDIVVECTEAVYEDHYDRSAGGDTGGSPYEGIWSPDVLRGQLEKALRSSFPGSVTAGKTAIAVRTTSARVDADVVPCFTYRLHFPQGGFREGTIVFKSDGSTVDNYPKLQLEHGRAKNNRTDYAYKKTVRILKRLQIEMAEDLGIDELPSYLIECLVFNCPDSYFAQLSWRARLQASLAHICNETRGNEPSDEEQRWLEVNQAKFLFSLQQKWTRSQANAFGNAAWNYMGFE